MYLKLIDMYMFNMLNTMFMVLISIAFLTLLERKILGYIQIREGPNKVSFMGLLQPISDAMKLFSKEIIMMLEFNYFVYLISPIFMMVVMLILWLNIPVLNNMIDSNFNLLMILCTMSLMGFSVSLSSWTSNNIYSSLGLLRTFAQTISYEVSMIFIMMSFIFLIESFNLNLFSFYQNYSWFFFMNIPISMIFFTSLLAELNRTPFDLSEGESELVSGFNTEYSSGLFAMMFIAEYGMIMFMAMLLNLFLMGDMNNIFFMVKFMLLLYLILLVRGTLPRMRFDNLMLLTWDNFLPISLSYLIIVMCMKFILI